MPKKSLSKTSEEAYIEKNAEVNGSFFDYLRFGESYTSLILGIVVVIISTVLILSFVHNKNISKNPNNDNSTSQIAQISPTEIPTATLAPTQTATTTTPKPTATPTKKVVQPTTTPKPTAVPAKAAPTAPKAHATPTKAQPTVVAKQVTPTTANNTMKNSSNKGTYVVVKDDNLWSIAEKTYQSGYNWVDIASANNLNDPGNIHVGDKLLLPNVTPKLATVQNDQKGTVTTNDTATTKGGISTVNPDHANGNIKLPLGKITGNQYTVVHGDTLWNIAVRAYGDGFQWKKIADANKLSCPSVIHADNHLIIPRA